jgi:TonB family protein
VSDPPPQNRARRWLRRTLLLGDALPLSLVVALAAHAAAVAVGIALQTPTQTHPDLAVAGIGLSTELQDRPGKGLGPPDDSPPSLAPPEMPQARIDLGLPQRAFDLPAHIADPPELPGGEFPFPAGGTAGSDLPTPPGTGSDTQPIFPSSRRSPPVSDSHASSSAQSGAAGAAGAQEGAQDGSLDPSSIPITYPPDALRQGWSGFVRARFDVDARGKIIRVQIVDPDPHDQFNNAVKQGLRRWRVPSFLWNTSNNMIPIRFTLPP